MLYNTVHVHVMLIIYMYQIQKEKMYSHWLLVGPATALCLRCTLCMYCTCTVHVQRVCACNVQRVWDQTGACDLSSFIYCT